jgi:hypothetical protein
MSNRRAYQELKAPVEDNRLLNSLEGDFEEENLSQSLPHSYISSRGRFNSVAGIPSSSERERDRKSRSRKRKTKSAVRSCFLLREVAAFLFNPNFRPSSFYQLFAFFSAIYG